MKKGYSFTELLIVLAVISLLAGGAMANFRIFGKKTELKVKAEELKSDFLETQIKARALEKKEKLVLGYKFVIRPHSYQIIQIQPKTSTEQEVQNSIERYYQMTQYPAVYTDENFFEAFFPSSLLSEKIIKNISFAKRIKLCIKRENENLPTCQLADPVWFFVAVPSGRLFNPENIVSLYLVNETIVGANAVRLDIDSISGNININPELEKI